MPVAARLLDDVSFQSNESRTEQRDLNVLRLIEHHNRVSPPHFRMKQHRNRTNQPQQRLTPDVLHDIAPHLSVLTRSPEQQCCDGTIQQRKRDMLRVMGHIVQMSPHVF